MCECEKKQLTIQEIEKEYGVEIYQIRYLCPDCKISIISKKSDAKGVSFKDWCHGVRAK